jgi:hypothetical protein
VRRRFSARAARPLARSIWACCAIGLSPALWSCGGLAADGPEPNEIASGVFEPGDAPPQVIRPRRETCADNPLLAECERPDDPCRDNPLSSGCSSAPDPDIPPEEPLALAAARNVLLSHCGQCHGPPLTEAQASANINYIDDWSRLLEAGLIERCSPERSFIIALMRAGSMPPAGAGLGFVSDGDIVVIERAIDFDCGTP